MKLKITKAFQIKLNHQLEYIAKDKPAAAQNFKDDVIAQMQRVIDLPFSNRRSIFFNNKNIRDLVFKGYVIVHKINEQDNEIIFFGFSKYQIKP